ncbi:MAG: AMP-binding protein, partial [Actinobacteria bacterium]|nr:AMP-binding protein [Actinomycetota bacterium]
MATKILPSNHQTADTVAAQFCVTVRDYPDRVALRWKDGDDFRQLTWAEYSQSAGRAAQALSDLGLEKGQRVVLMMRNRPEFHIAD